MFFVSCLRNLCLPQWHKDILLCFVLEVLWFQLLHSVVMIHFEFHFSVWGEIGVKVHFSSWISNWPKTIYWKDNFFFFFYELQWWHCHKLGDSIWISLLLLSLFHSTYLSISSCQYCHFISSLYSQSSKSSSFVLSYCLGYSSSLEFLYKFQNETFNFDKNTQTKNLLGFL